MCILLSAVLQLVNDLAMSTPPQGLGGLGPETVNGDTRFNFHIQLLVSMVPFHIQLLVSVVPFHIQLVVSLVPFHTVTSSIEFYFEIFQSSKAGVYQLQVNLSFSKLKVLTRTRVSLDEDLTFGCIQQLKLPLYHQDFTSIIMGLLKNGTIQFNSFVVFHQPRFQVNNTSDVRLADEFEVATSPENGKTLHLSILSLASNLGFRKVAEPAPIVLVRYQFQAFTVVCLDLSAVPKFTVRTCKLWYHQLFLVYFLTALATIENTRVVSTAIEPETLLRNI